MRLPRAFTLPPGSIFHFMWKSINGEFFLRTDSMKRLFLNRFFKFFKRTKGAVAVYSFAVMSNHFHMAGKLRDDCVPLSDWARSAHSSIGLCLNKILNRHGPVAHDRPKTRIAQDQGALKRLMFYIDWNPVRAGLCAHPADYEFSTYRFYAFGEVNTWTEGLTAPDWYLRLGSTPGKRQARYRLECDRYAAKGLLPQDDDEDGCDRGHATGSMSFVAGRNRLLAKVAALLRTKSMPTTEIEGLFKLALWSDDPPATAATGAPRGPAPEGTGGSS